MNSWVMFAGVAGLPWGGVGQSGFGRIHGAEGLRQMAQTKSTVRQRFAMPVALTSFDRKPATSRLLQAAFQVIHGRHQLPTRDNDSA